MLSLTTESSGTLCKVESSCDFNSNDDIVLKTFSEERGRDERTFREKMESIENKIEMDGGEGGEFYRKFKRGGEVRGKIPRGC